MSLQAVVQCEQLEKELADSHAEAASTAARMQKDWDDAQQAHMTHVKELTQQASAGHSETQCKRVCILMNPCTLSCVLHNKFMDTSGAVGACCMTKSM